MRSILLFTIALALVPAASAQDECAQSSPCEIPVNTTPEGLYFQLPSAQVYNVTVGDWHTFDVWNTHDSDHEMYLAGYDVAFTAGCFDCSAVAKPAAIKMDKAGTFELWDLDSNRFITLQVVLNDVNDVEAGDPPIFDSHSEDEGAPGLGIVALIGALVAVAVRRK